MAAVNLESKTRGRDQGWVVALVSVGHFYSHFVMLALPPVFLLIQPELGVTFTALGAVVSAMSVTTAVGQLPAGFLVDRFGARYILIVGVAIMGLSLLLVGLTKEYWTLFFLFLVAGFGNSVFHPANFSILSARLENQVFGRAVSIHSFMGYVGWAGASLVMLPLALWTDWRTALSIIGIIGLAVAVIMLFGSSYLSDRDYLNSNKSKPNTKILTIPFELFITEQKAVNSDIGRAVKEMFGKRVPNRIIIILKLIKIKHFTEKKKFSNNVGKWAEYKKSLPTEYNTPTFRASNREGDDS